MASVRGIGVAVMISWCGMRPCFSPFCASFRRCCTPKRCCSSTMTSPRRANSIPSWKSACVPTTMRTSPAARAASALRRVRALCEPESSATVSPSGCEPGAQVAPVLLGEQLGRRHERRLHPAAGGTRGRRGGDHGLAAADVALHEPRHGGVRREVRLGFRERAALCAGQGEGKRGEEARRELRLVRERERRVLPERVLAQPQREVVREQLLEGEPALRGVGPGGELREAGRARRVVQVVQRLGERRQPPRERGLARDAARRGRSARARAAPRR